MKKALFLSLFSVWSCLAIAECLPNACVDVHIDTLYVNKSGVIYVGTSGNEKLLDCDAVADVYATLRFNEPGASVIYSTLLSAHMAQKKVLVRIANGTAGCSILYVTLERQ